MSGIIKGDEIMVINGAIVSDLDMMYIESVLQVDFHTYTHTHATLNKLQTHTHTWINIH